MTCWTDRTCPPPDTRFWAKVNRAGPNGCWVWFGSTSKGYGRLTRGTQQYRAHRVSYEGRYGPIAAGLQVDHLCGNTCCVNPAHLKAVTARENTLRSNAWSGVNSRKDHCPQGHQYTGDNLYVIPSTGGRACRICKAIARSGERDRRGVRHKQGTGPGRPGRRAHSTKSGGVAHALDLRG